MFHAVTTSSSVDACAQAVREAIIRGELSIGEALPAERAMAESFGVNRVTVRSALDRLTTAGLLSRKQGSGYRVLDYRRTAGPELLGAVAASARHDATQLLGIVEDLLLMRRNMARALLEALGERLTQSGLDRFDEALDRFAEVARRVTEGAAADSPEAVDEVMAADMAVLLTLLDASGSAVLPLCFNPILRVLGELPELRRVMYASPQTNLAAYRVFRTVLASLVPHAVQRAPKGWLERALAVVASRDAHVLNRFQKELA